ncbi:MAG: hypothetical protein JXR23_06505 [Pontiellaceae bacterium]|nr:hypothetical protein [Pontiellaceae bacterium]
MSLEISLFILYSLGKVKVSSLSLCFFSLEGAEAASIGILFFSGHNRPTFAFPHPGRRAASHLFTDIEAQKEGGVKTLPIIRDWNFELSKCFCGNEKTPSRLRRKALFNADSSG